jgi:hypothetical protein
MYKGEKIFVILSREEAAILNKSFRRTSISDVQFLQTVDLR